MQPVLATAPAGIGDGYLGVPLDAHFRPLQGAAAGPLFRGPQVSRFPVNQVSHDTVVLTDSFSLDANIAAWRLFEVGGGVANERRFASYRAFQIEYVSVVNDRTEMNAPPPGAFFYPWKIYYGHAYEAVFSGTSNGFHAGVAAEFRAIGGDIQTFARARSLDVRIFGLGLTPATGQAIFARTPDEVRSSYSTSGPAVPIFIEYRLIPGLSSPPRGGISWARPVTVEVVYDQLDVIEDGTWWSTPWYVQAFCACNGVEVQLRDNQALPRGTSVEDGHSYPMNWHTNISVVDGDRVDWSRLRS